MKTSSFQRKLLAYMHFCCQSNNRTPHAFLFQCLKTIEPISTDDSLLCLVHPLTSMLVLMSVGSHVVRLPIIIITSRLACDGSSFRDLSAASNPFCNDGSPTSDVRLRAVTALMCLRAFPASSLMRSARLLCIIITPIWLIGF